MTDINEEDLTTAYMLGRHDGRKDAERLKSLATAHGSLLPCPFCGLNGEAMAWRNHNGEIELIEHPNTDCILSDLRCEDVSQWNQRENNED
jgi:hypothetical protein